MTSGAGWPSPAGKGSGVHDRIPDQTVRGQGYIIAWGVSVESLDCGKNGYETLGRNIHRRRRLLHPGIQLLATDHLATDPG